MKVIFLDYGVFMHRAIFAWRMNKAVPPTYTALSMMLANLKRVGVSPEDQVIVAVDSPHGSWRREVDANYKADRRGKRQAQTDIAWDKMFEMFNKLKANLNISTPFHIIELEKLEADDIIGFGVRYYKDNKCVIVSTDTDFEQLASLSNVRLFSPITKCYKNIEHPDFIIAKKMRKEATDNLKTEVLNEEDYIKRLTIIDLLHLPVEVETAVQDAFEHLEMNKAFDYELLPFRTIKNNFMEIYNSNKIVKEDTYGKAKKRKKKAVRNEEEVSQK
jgi:hypothetical protein